MILKKIVSLFIKILNTIYSTYFNFRVFPLSIAVKFPIYISIKTKIKCCPRNSIIINGEIYRKMIQIGSYGVPFVRKENSIIEIRGNGKLIFNGSVNIAEGIKLYCDGGKIIIGNKSYIGSNTTFQCHKLISIGNEFLGGWNISIRDTDGHAIVCNGAESKMDDCIYINDKVWVAAECRILKGTVISKGSIIGCNSVICGLKVIDSNSLIAGIPAHVIKNNVEWIE